MLLAVNYIYIYLYISLKRNMVSLLQNPYFTEPIPSITTQRCVAPELRFIRQIFCMNSIISICIRTGMFGIYIILLDRMLYFVVPPIFANLYLSIVSINETYCHFMSSRNMFLVYFEIIYLCSGTNVPE